MKSLNNNRMKTLRTRSIGILPIILSASAMLGLCQPLLANTAPTRQYKPRIEVCFVLDTTGSMGGLIEGAKQKIWSIANEMISAQPTPELKLGLIGYRDRGDEYVVKSFSLTDDIDAIYGHLREFQADGGGDAPESVNEALAEAIHKMPWSSDKKVLKIIFLVGDAPPHMDYSNGPKYPDLCREAAKNAPVAAMADRLTYNSKTGRAMQGRGELVDALNDKTLKLEEIDQKQLPTELQKLDREELAKRITKARDERADLQKQIVEVS